MVSVRGKWTAVALLVAIGLGVTGACSAGDDDAETATADEAGVVDADRSAGAATGGVAAGSADQAGLEGASVVPASVVDARIVKTATLHVEVAAGRFDGAFAQTTTIASSVGGFVAGSTSRSDDDGASAVLTLRVPAERFDEVRASLVKLGERKREELKGDDVGGQLTDLEARLRNLRVQEEAIRALMARSKDVPETLTVQNQLSGVREQIEQLDAHRARLQDAVTYATITVELTEPGAAVNASKPSPISNALRRAVDGTEAMIAGLIIVLGYLTPLAVLGLLGYVALRVLSRVRAGAPLASTEHGA